MHTYRWLVSLAVVLIAAPCALFACLAEFRSVDYQAAHSPLIFIGEVQQVEDIKQPKLIGPKKANPIAFPADRDDFDSGGKPTVATVRVLEVLKGEWRDRTIRVHSGPIRSCAPYNVYYTFKQGQRSIFMLAEAPVDGVARVLYGGSVLSVSDRSIVEARIVHARAFQEKYLSRLRKESPEVHAAAAEANRLIRAAVAEYDALKKNEHGNPVDRQAVDKIESKLFEQLKTTAIEGLVAAHAIDWLDPAASWPQSPLWGSVARKLSDKRADEVVTAEKAQIARQLRAAGVEQNHIDAYLAALKTEDFRGADFTFPPNGPYAFGEAKYDLTTDFLYRFHNFDRGSMFVVYGMTMDRLGGLDPQRAGATIEAMFGSDDKNVRLIARRAIERIPGEHFAPLILNSMSERDSTDWRALIKQDDAEGTARRIKALVAASRAHWTKWGQSYFWQLMRQGECFEQAAIQEAIAILAQVEVKNDDASKATTDELRAYLEAAARAREQAEKPKTAEEYRKQFEDAQRKRCG